MNYRWTLRDYDNKNAVPDLVKALKIPKSIVKVLVARGFTDEKSILKFFNPSLNDLYDPFLMKDMDKAVDKILDGIQKKQQFWIHGDYDVDGTTSVATLTLFLRELGANVEYYLPDRFKDGYGINDRSINAAIAINTSILITVDTGISSFDMLNIAAKNNIETIICDHHEPAPTLPNAYAILDPLLPDSNYPFKSLAACGVVFKLIQAISIKLNKTELPFKYIDFVAIASAADMVPLVDENRILLHYGLKQINENNTRTGIKSLIYCAGLKQNCINTSSIVYAIAPLINAAGRLGQASRSVDLFTTDDSVKALNIAQLLEDENRKRRVFDQKLFNEVIPIAEKQIAEGHNCLIIYGEKWHPGVLGIVCSRLVDKFHLPTILLTNVGKFAKGSARCNSNLDIHLGLKYCSALLLEYGGHKHAAGLTLNIENIDTFRKQMETWIFNYNSGEVFVPEYVVDCELNFSEFRPDLFEWIEKFKPFGHMNCVPLFFAKSVKCKNYEVKNGTWMNKIRIIQDNFEIDAVGQDINSFVEIYQSGQPFSIIYSVEQSAVNGIKIPQIVIKDIKPDNTKWN